MNKVKIAGEEVDLKRGVDYIGVTIPFVIHDGKGNVLLQKRSKNCRDEQERWDVGGGSLEFGEKLEEGVIREVGEELCTKPLKVEFLNAYEALRDNNGTPTHWMAFVHAVLVNPRDIKIGEPHKIDEIGWFNSSNLPSPLHSCFKESFSAAKDKGIVK